MNKKEQQPPTKSILLTQSVENYTTETFPLLSFVTAETIQQRVDQFVQKKIPQ